MLDLFGEKEIVLPENIHKRYDNGELVTKERMEDEDWYSDLYQPFLTFAMGFHPSDVDELYKSAIKDFKNFFNEELSEKNKERILRWCVLIIERQGGQKDFA